MTARWFVRGVATFAGDAAKLRPAILPPMLRRRTSAPTRAVAWVLGELSERSGADLRTAPIVLGTDHGEIAVTVDLLAAALDPEADVSPTRFHNSVHNTALGYVSIACGNRAGHTTISAGPDTLAMTLVEGAARLGTGAGDVLVVVADEPVPPPLPRRGPAEVTAVAFHLSADAAGAAAEIAVEGPGPVPEPRPADPCVAAVALARAVVGGDPTVVPLSAADPCAGEGPPRPGYTARVTPS